MCIAVSYILQQPLIFTASNNAYICTFSEQLNYGLPMNIVFTFVQLLALLHLLVISTLEHGACHVGLLDSVDTGTNFSKPGTWYYWFKHGLQSQHHQAEDGLQHRTKV
jgi:hypothetical protein